MGGNVLHGVLDASDPVGLGVGDLDRELVLDGHDDLYGVEGIEAEIVAELRRRLDLRGVDLVEVLDHGEDTFLNLRGGEEGLGTFGGGEVHCSEGGWGGGGGGSSDLFARNRFWEICEMSLLFLLLSLLVSFGRRVRRGWGKSGSGRARTGRSKTKKGA